MSEQPSVLPPEPWYTSPVQIGAVIAALAQVASILIRWLGLPVTDAQLEQYSADALQLVTIGAGLYAIVKRQQSVVAPLTLTRKGAEQKAVTNPPLLAADPTKIPRPPQETPGA